MSQTVLVTGGAGYVGSHACKALARAGYTPVVLDNLVYGHRENVRWGPLIQGDMADHGLLDSIFSKYEPEAVLHFAAWAYVSESVSAPGKYYRNNVSGTLTLLETMRDHGCRNIVFSSSCATYGVPETTPITESTPQRPINPYGWSKFMVERMLEDFECAHGMRHASLRYFNAAGADPEGELGEDHTPETHLIPLVLEAALDSNRSIAVFGDDYPTEDGSCVRDYVHVTDLAEAHIQALEYIRNHDSGAFNLGTGRGHTVKQIIHAARRATGRHLSERIESRRPGDPPALYADNTLARQALGWEPRFTDIEETISHAWTWLNKLRKTP
jgi:UDP-arabinose 4-epimerase